MKQQRTSQRGAGSLGMLCVIAFIALTLFGMIWYVHRPAEQTAVPETTATVDLETISTLAQGVPVRINGTDITLTLDDVSYRQKTVGPLAGAPLTNITVLAETDHGARILHFGGASDIENTDVGDIRIVYVSGWPVPRFYLEKKWKSPAEYTCYSQESGLSGKELNCNFTGENGLTRYCTDSYRAWSAVNCPDVTILYDANVAAQNNGTTTSRWDIYDILAQQIDATAFDVWEFTGDVTTTPLDVRQYQRSQSPTAGDETYETLQFREDGTFVLHNDRYGPDTAGRTGTWKLESTPIYITASFDDGATQRFEIYSLDAGSVMLRWL